jgi:hypothetical protein
MSNLVHPIFTTPLGKSSIRFFRSPLQGADFPWHGHDDLMACLGLSREAKRIIKRKLVNDWKESIKTVATDGGIVTIAPHFVAKGFISALIAGGITSESFLDEYIDASAVALRMVTSGLSIDEAVAFAVEAHKRHMTIGAA